MHRIDRMRSRGSALWASLAWATRILSGDRVPSRASPVFFNTFLPVRRRTSSAAGATTERQCSLQGAELAPRREEQAGSEVGGRCTAQNALADCSSSQLALSQRRCARAVRCFTLCAGNFPSRAPLSALATNAATQPLLVALCGGAAGFDRTHPPTTCLQAPGDIRTLGAPRER